MDNFKGTRDRKKEKKNSKFDKSGKFSSKHVRQQELLFEKRKTTYSNSNNKENKKNKLLYRLKRNLSL